MEIDLTRIADDEVISLTHKYVADTIQLTFNDQKCTEDVSLVATGYKQADCFFVNGSIETMIEQTCSRCLEVIKESVAENVSLSLNLDGASIIDITEDIREILIFWHPMKFVCQEDCKGLCPSCGINRNNETCECDVLSDTIIT